MCVFVRASIFRHVIDYRMIVIICILRGTTRSTIINLFNDSREINPKCFPPVAWDGDFNQNQQD